MSTRGFVVEVARRCCVRLRDNLEHAGLTVADFTTVESAEEVGLENLLDVELAINVVTDELPPRTIERFLPLLTGLSRTLTRPGRKVRFVMPPNSRGAVTDLGVTASFNVRGPKRHFCAESKTYRSFNRYGVRFIFYFAPVGAT